MKCKYCQAELESNSSVCPACHKDNLKDDLKGLKIAALVLVCLVMLVLLAGLVCYGVTGSFVPDWFGSTAGTGSSENADTSHKVITPSGIITVEDKDLDAAMEAVVATMGDYQLTNRDLQFYYWVCAYNDTGDADLTADLTQQIYDEETGKTYHQYFLEMAVNNWQEIMLMYDLAAKAGYELPESYQEQLDSMEEDLEYYVYVYTYYYGYDLSTVDDLIKMQFGPGCDYQAYYDYTYNYYYGALYWTDEVENFEVTEDDINNYFTENEESLANDYDISVTKDFGNLVDIRNILVNVITKEEEAEDGTKTTVEDWDATLAKAQEIYNEWLAGEMTEESYIALVEKYSEDEGSKTAGGLYTDLYRDSMSAVDVRHILVFPEGATADTITSQEWSEEAWAYAQNKAQQILDQWLAGEMTEESFVALANEHSDDNKGEVTNGGLYEDVYVGEMVEEFEDWCFDDSRVAGDYGIIRSVYGYHVMYYVRSDREAEDWCFDETRAAGDVGIAKTDEGYMLLYFVEAEEAWHRYSRYGVQAEKAVAALEEMVEANPVTMSEEKLMICLVG